MLTKKKIDLYYKMNRKQPSRKLPYLTRTCFSRKKSLFEWLGKPELIENKVHYWFFIREIELSPRLVISVKNYGRHYGDFTAIYEDDKKMILYKFPFSRFDEFFSSTLDDPEDVKPLPREPRAPLKPLNLW